MRSNSLIILLIMHLHHTGWFFNWPSPEFAKCWPVSNWFQKNVKSPRLAPPPNDRKKAKERRASTTPCQDKLSGRRHFSGNKWQLAVGLLTHGQCNLSVLCKIFSKQNTKLRTSSIRGTEVHNQDSKAPPVIFITFSITLPNSTFLFN